MCLLVIVYFLLTCVPSLIPSTTVSHQPRYRCPFPSVTPLLPHPLVSLVCIYVCVFPSLFSLVLLFSLSVLVLYLRCLECLFPGPHVFTLFLIFSLWFSGLSSAVVLILYFPAFGSQFLSPAILFLFFIVHTFGFLTLVTLDALSYTTCLPACVSWIQVILCAVTVTRNRTGESEN